MHDPNAEAFFVAALIAAALANRIDTFDRENAHLRVVAQNVACPYGHRASNGACTLGYPGCGCMDDLIALQAWEPKEALPAVVRLARMNRAMEVRLTEAGKRIKMAARSFESIAEGFEAERVPSRAAAARSMARLMEVPL
jgi:hypothetical protein